MEITTRGISVTSRYSQQDINYVKEKLVEYNAQHAPTLQRPFYETINILLKDGESNVIGGMLGEMQKFNYDLRIFWIAEKYRGQGLGTYLLSELEQNLKAKGCTLIYTSSYDFQAPDFYKKNGFEVFGVLEGCPEGHVCYWLKKYL